MANTPKRAWWNSAHQAPLSSQCNTHRSNNTHDEVIHQSIRPSPWSALAKLSAIEALDEFLLLVHVVCVYTNNVCSCSFGNVTSGICIGTAVANSTGYQAPTGHQSNLCPNSENKAG